jgi:hypothetical protein
MSIAAQWQSDKTSSLVGMAEDLRQLVDRAGREGRSLHERERSVPDSLLTMGYAAAELFLVQQGNGGHHPSGRPPASTHRKEPTIVAAGVSTEVNRYHPECGGRPGGDRAVILHPTRYPTKELSPSRSSIAYPRF